MQSYVGSYRGERGLAAEITLEDGQLFATPAGQDTLRLVPLSSTSFKPIAFEGVSLSFDIEAGETIGVTLHQDQQQMKLKREGEPLKPDLPQKL